MRLIERKNDKWTILKEFAVAAAAGGKLVLGAKIKLDKTELWADGKAVATIDATGQVGLFVQSGEAAFEVEIPAEAGSEK